MSSIKDTDVSEGTKVYRQRCVTATWPREATTF